jgi:hypothetical protein
LSIGRKLGGGTGQSIFFPRFPLKILVRIFRIDCCFDTWMIDRLERCNFDHDIFDRNFVFEQLIFLAEISDIVSRIVDAKIYQLEKSKFLIFQFPTFWRITTIVCKPSMRCFSNSNNEILKKKIHRKIRNILSN